MHKKERERKCACFCAGQRKMITNLQSAIFEAVYGLLVYMPFSDKFFLAYFFSALMVPSHSGS